MKGVQIGKSPMSHPGTCSLKVCVQAHTLRLPEAPLNSGKCSPGPPAPLANPGVPNASPSGKNVRNHSGCAELCIVLPLQRTAEQPSFFPFEEYLGVGSFGHLFSVSQMPLGPTGSSFSSREKKRSRKERRIGGQGCRCAFPGQAAVRRRSGERGPGSRFAGFGGPHQPALPLPAVAPRRLS